MKHPPFSYAEPGTARQNQMEAMALGNTRSLFAGAMGPDGFISCFDHLIDEHLLRRKLILKGGPGVGKTTFMRRVHAALCADGEPSALYFCSGDPDSLDAVCVPGRGLLILDGTAPHIVDPQVPGARDSIINLGDCLDEASMRPRLGHIQGVMADHRSCMRRATSCLRAARALSEDNAAAAAAAADETKLSRMTQALIASALDGSAKEKHSPARARPVIADAVTPKGEVSLIAENAPSRVIRLTGHFAFDLSAVLRAVSRAALAAGLCTEEFLDPRCPGRLLHLGIPALDLLVTTSDRLPSELIFDFAACLPQGSLLRHECALEQGLSAVQLNLHRAAAALKRAKELHDELETFYVPNMDFSLWQKKLDETLATIS